MPNSSNWSINRAPSGASTHTQLGPGSKGNEEMDHIPQISKAKTEPSDGLETHTRTLFGGQGESYTSA